MIFATENGRVGNSVFKLHTETTIKLGGGGLSYQNQQFEVVGKWSYTITPVVIDLRGSLKLDSFGKVKIAFLGNKINLKIFNQLDQGKQKVANYQYQV
jgi:hypothetical protein